MLDDNKKNIKTQIYEEEKKTSLSICKNKSLTTQNLRATKLLNY